MWSFEIVNKETGESDIIYGYSWLDAVDRAGIDPDEWEVVYQEYED